MTTCTSKGLKSIIVEVQEEQIGTPFSYRPIPVFWLKLLPEN